MLLRSSVALAMLRPLIIVITSFGVSLTVFLLLLLYEFVVFWTDGIIGYPVTTWTRWIPVFTSALLWPVVVAILDSRDADAESVVDRPHPFGIAAGEVVVDGDHMDAAAGERVEEDGQRRGQGLPLAGLHLGDRAVVEDHAADQLDVVVALADRPPRRLAGQRERLGQQVVEGLAAAPPLAQGVGLLAEFGVR